jgi:guanine deaminase
VRNEQIIAEAHNEVLSSRDPTAHAETLAIRRASQKLGTFDLSDCDIYTNGAPCCMCAAAMLWARVRKSYYILSMDDSDKIGLGDSDFYAELARPLDNRAIVPMIQLSDLSAVARDVYMEWYQSPDRQQY